MEAGISQTLTGRACSSLAIDTPQLASRVECVPGVPDPRRAPRRDVGVCRLADGARGQIGMQSRRGRRSGKSKGRAHGSLVSDLSSFIVVPQLPRRPRLAKLTAAWEDCSSRTQRGTLPSTPARVPLCGLMSSGFSPSTRRTSACTRIHSSTAYPPLHHITNKQEASPPPRASYLPLPSAGARPCGVPRRPRMLRPAHHGRERRHRQLRVKTNQPHSPRRGCQRPRARRSTAPRPWPSALLRPGQLITAERIS